MTTGGLPSNRRYKYVYFWVDHHSQFVYTTMHETKKAGELLRSKQEFEEYAAKFGVNIRNIRADNGVYAAKIIQDSCLKKQQNLTFCAVGAHWQNGIAERFIGSIVQRARTILLHAMAKRPSVITEKMWPFALRHMIAFHNASIRRDKNAIPYQLFTGQDAPWTLKDFRVFGPPAYVLHKRLQDGDHFSKWKARSWQGAYVRPSTCHASNVPLIYNPATTHVFPQFHVVHDEAFTSLTHLATDTMNELRDKLYKKTLWSHPSKHPDSTESYHFDSFWDDPPLSPKPEGRGRKRSHSTPVQLPSLHTDPHLPTQNITRSIRPTSPRHPEPEGVTTRSIQTVLPSSDLNPAVSAAGAFIDSPTRPITGTSTTKGTVPVSEGVSPHIEPNAVSAQHRSLDNNDSAVSVDNSAKFRAQYAIYHGTTDFRIYKQQRGINGNIYVACPNNQHSLMHSAAPDMDQKLPHVFSTFIDLPVLYTEASIQSFLAMNNKEDTLTQSQMLRSADSQDFIAAQIPEIRGLEKMQVFQYKNISELPPRAKLLSSIWSYRRKRRPNGELVKHKARICVDGSQQQYGHDYWETYAPVVSWSTVRLVLLLSTILNLKSRQVDYTQAFPQAELTDPVFMRLPQGWYLATDGTLQPHEDPKYNDTSHFIQLKRILYGCKQAARNWFQYLNQGLLGEGFIQSKIDPCLYLRSDCIMVVYNDDCLIFSRDDSIIDDLVNNLSKTFLLEDQGTVHKTI